jgi:hypothetical protein
VIPDAEAIEQMYVAGMSFGIFDRRCLLPINQLAFAVKAESGHEVSESDLHRFTADGWYAPLPFRQDDDPSDCGVPLFIPSRIGLLLELRERGYGASELRSFAAWEDFWIDNFRELELDYEDDDVELLLRHHNDSVASAKGLIEFSKEPATFAQAKGDLERARAQISNLERIRGKTLSPTLQEKVKRAAFSVRAVEEGIRITFVEEDRAKCRAGFSPFVLFQGYEWSATEGHFFRNLEWRMTLRSPWIEEWSLGVRVPEFILDGDRITTVQPLIPSAYKKAWDERNIDGYFEALAELRGETRCLHCRSLLAKDRNPRQRYCSDACRNAAKQSRLRANNPASVFNAQSNYYQSLARDEQKMIRPPATNIKKVK